MRYIKNISEPWFSLIKLGLKTCEGRLNKGDFAKMQPGDVIEFTNQELGFHRSCVVRVISIKEYPSFEKYLVSETLKRCLPGISTYSDGLSVYYKYFSTRDEAEYGIVAIGVEII